MVEGYRRHADQRQVRANGRQLLESQHFGESMAVYWLDLVRFADTVGYHGDQDHSITPYRDYVIDALNLNLPRIALLLSSWLRPSENRQLTNGRYWL